VGGGVGEPRQEARDTGHAEATGAGAVAVTGVVHGGIVLAPPAPAAVSGYLHQVRRLAAPGFRGRERELAAMAAFCTAPAPAPAWWRWLAPAWSGKTALLARFVLYPPPGVRLVPFFITARLAGQSTRAAFCEVVQRQLCAVLGEREPVVTEHTRDESFLHTLERAAARCAAGGRRLVLVVDGLDEDRGVTPGGEGHSIASLLPADPPHGARVIVAGRPHPPVPADVPEDHPLRGTAVDHGLEPSAHARAVRREAERDLLRLIGSDGPGRRLTGVMTAAGGGLTAADLAELLAPGTSRGLIRQELNASTGRAFTSRPPLWPGPDAEDVYLLAHEEVQQAAADLLPPAELAGHRELLHAWAGRWAARSWPPGTPEYLLRGYPQLLRATGDRRRYLALAQSRPRHDALWRASGADAAALDEISGGFTLLGTTGPDAPPTGPVRPGPGAADPGPDAPEPSTADLAHALLLAVRRDALHRRAANTPAELPEVWARLGDAEKALASARAHGDREQRTRALVRVALALPRPRLAAESLSALHEALDLARPQHPGTAGDTAGRGAVAEALARTGHHAAGIALAESLPDYWRTEALLGIGGILRDFGDPLRAAGTVALVRDARHRDPFLTGLGRELALAGRAADARGVLAPLSPPARTKALAVQARALSGAGHTGRALALVRTLDTAASPDGGAGDVTDRDSWVDALMLAGIVLAGVGEAAEAVRLAEAAAAAALAGRNHPGPDRDRAFAAVAGALLGAGKFAAAVGLARRLEDPRRAWTLADAAVALAESGHPRRAVDLCRTITADRWWDWARARVARALRAAGRGAAADRLAAEIRHPVQRAAASADGPPPPVPRSPEDVRRALNRAALYGRGRHGERLAPLISEVTEAAREGRAEEAAAAAERAAAPADRARLLALAALAAAEAGHRDQAAACARRAAALVGPDAGRRAPDTAVLTEFARAMTEAARHREAGEWLDRLVALAEAAPSVAERDRALAGLVPVMALAAVRRDRADLCDRALALNDRIASGELRVDTLVEVIGVLALHRWHERALHLAGSLADADDRSTARRAALTGMARAGLHERALPGIRRLDAYDKDLARAEIALAMAHNGHVAEAVPLVEKIREPVRLGMAMSALGAILARHGLLDEARGLLHRAQILADEIIPLDIPVRSELGKARAAIAAAERAGPADRSPPEPGPGDRSRLLRDLATRDWRPLLEETGRTAPGALVRAAELLVATDGADEGPR
jgi:tetratricopeptide (TPR) repeat protein